MPSIIVSIERSRLSPTIRIIRCPHCHESLDVHQPDLDLPDRLLGTCGECKAWYLLDREHGVMVLIPPELTLRTA